MKAESGARYSGLVTSASCMKSAFARANTSLLIPSGGAGDEESEPAGESGSFVAFSFVAFSFVAFSFVAGESFPFLAFGFFLLDPGPFFLGCSSSASCSSCSDSSFCMPL